MLLAYGFAGIGAALSLNVNISLLSLKVYQITTKPATAQWSICPYIFIFSRVLKLKN
jgi:hypothetical protein